tara:strand:+ start:387 stop:827 length:441 start_codon:yes stop_codon:yes gene_type:complete
LFDEGGYEKYYPSDNKHTRHFDHFPVIITSCEGCGADIETRWNRELCNKQFCSQKCNNLSGPRKRSKRAYFVLKILKHTKEPISAQSMIHRLDRQYGTLYNSNKISMILRGYKGIVGSFQHSEPYPHKTYFMTDWAKQKPLKTLLI